jgi:membrane protein
MTEGGMKKRLEPLFGLLVTAGKGIFEDKVPMMGAALAYYTAFSIAPLLVIVLGVLGMVFGKKGDTQVFGTIGAMVGENGALAIQGMVQGAAQQPHRGMIATVIGSITLLAGASGIFAQLQESLNMIWKVAKKPTAGIWSTVRQRLLSFGMVGVIAFMLLVSLLASAGISAAESIMGDVLKGGAWLWQTLNFVISIAVTTVLFGLIFKVIPDVKISWREGFVGGLFTAVLFSIGKFVIGAYLGHSGIASTYGAAGSLIVVLLWVFYSSQIVLFGAEFTQAYATRGGKAVVPRRDAARTITSFTEAAIGEKILRRKST